MRVSESNGFTRVERKSTWLKIGEGEEQSGSANS
jgi:hypothetical protein